MQHVHFTNLYSTHRAVVRAKTNTAENRKEAGHNKKFTCKVYLCCPLTRRMIYRLSCRWSKLSFAFIAESSRQFIFWCTELELEVPVTRKLTWWMHKCRRWPLLPSSWAHRYADACNWADSGTFQLLSWSIMTSQWTPNDNLKAMSYAFLGYQRPLWLRLRLSAKLRFVIAKDWEVQDVMPAG